MKQEQATPEIAAYYATTANACVPAACACFFWIPVPVAMPYGFPNPFAWAFAWSFRTAALRAREEAEQSVRRDRWLARLSPGLN